MPILLSDKEIREIYNGDFWPNVVHMGCNPALKAQLKKVVEYIDKNFYIGVDGNGEIEYAGDYERWKALKKEAYETHD